MNSWLRSVAAYITTPVGSAVRLGVIGAVLVAVGSYGVGDIPRNSRWLQNVHLTWITYGHGKSLSTITFWAGVITMLIAWVILGRRIRRRVGPRPSTAELRWSMLAWAAPMIVAVPMYSRDVYAYLGQAVLVSHGFNPYVDGPAHHPGPLLDSMAQVWATTTAPYGPAFMLLTRGVVAVTGENAALGVLVMRLVMLPGFLLAVWAVPALCDVLDRRDRAKPRWAAEIGSWLAIFNPMVLIHVVGGPHVEMLLMGVLAAGVLLAVRGHHAAGIAVLAAATAVKVTAGIATPFALWIWLHHIRGERALRVGDAIRVITTTVALSAAVFAGFTVADGHGLGWLAGLGWADRIINWLTIPTLAAHLVTWVSAPWTALPLLPVLSVSRTVGAAVLAVALVAIWWIFRRDSHRAVAGIAAAMLAVLLLEPSTLPWYYTWCLVIAAAIPMHRAVLGAVAGASTLLLLLFQPDDSILLYQAADVLMCGAFAVCVGWSLATDRGMPRRWRQRDTALATDKR